MDEEWENVKMLRNDTPSQLAFAREDDHGGSDLQRVRFLVSDDAVNSIICELHREIEELRARVETLENQ